MLTWHFSDWTRKLPFPRSAPNLFRVVHAKFIFPRSARKTTFSEKCTQNYLFREVDVAESIFPCVAGLSMRCPMLIGRGLLFEPVFFFPRMRVISICVMACSRIYRSLISSKENSPRVHDTFVYIMFKLILQGYFMVTMRNIFLSKRISCFRQIRVYNVQIWIYMDNSW
jgi:hypothetical protein